MMISKWWLPRMWLRFKRFLKIEYSPNQKYEARNN